MNQRIVGIMLGTVLLVPGLANAQPSTRVEEIATSGGARQWVVRDSLNQAAVQSLNEALAKKAGLTTEKTQASKGDEATKRAQKPRGVTPDGLSGPSPRRSSDSDTGRDGASSSAATLNSVWTNPYWSRPTATASGFGSGSWTGGGTANYIQLNESVCWGGIAVQISVPAGAGFSGTNDCRSYSEGVGSEYHNVNINYNDKSFNGFVGYSYIYLNSVTFTVSPVVRYGGFSYQPVAEAMTY